jgi:murein DD-endopeptidase MepM/ murein hydrolase activator NlpD
MPNLRMVRHSAVILIALALSACAAEPPPPAPRVGRDILLPRETETIEAVVPPNGTLDSILRDHDLPVEVVQAVVESARAVFNPRQIRANQPYRLVRSVDGWLREFEYEIDIDRFLRIVSPNRLTPQVLEAAVLPFEKQTETVSIRGQIDSEHSSLIAAMDEAGEKVELAIALAELFGGEIDFQSDLQPGDSFELLVQKSSREGQFAGYGPILAARFQNEGREYQAIRWVNPSTTKAGFYDQNGRSLKRTILKSPLKFEPRVTSGFSRRRLHPVHHVVRAHLGVDYAAPHGAPVVAVADGVVVSAGWAGGGGRQVRLRHSGGLESYYLHLSSFAKGIRSGARVEQGQLIGRVGSSGTATGPHLDYRIRRSGRFVDPRREHAKQPPGEPIPATYLETFRIERDTVLKQLSTTAAAGRPAARPDAVKANQ